MPVGKRIYLQRKLPDAQLIEDFKKIPASNVGGCNGTELRDEYPYSSGQQS